MGSPPGEEGREVAWLAIPRCPVVASTRMKRAAAMLACGIAASALGCGAPAAPRDPWTSDVWTTPPVRVEPAGGWLTPRGESAGAAVPVEEMRRRLEASRRVWRAQVAARGPRYAYQRREASRNGEGLTTLVVVEGERVVERYSKETGGGAPQVGQPATSWAERGGTVGSHPKAHPAVTLDALYDECAQVLARADDANANVHFVIGSDGILASCVISFKRCVDECSAGVTIDAVRMGRE